MSKKHTKLSSGNYQKFAETDKFTRTKDKSDRSWLIPSIIIINFWSSLFNITILVNNNTEILLINLDLEERIIKEIIANYKIITKFIICSKVFVWRL